MNGNATIGFIIAGAALIVFTGAAPRAGLAFAGILGLGVLLTHSDQVTAAIGTFTASLGK